MQRSYYDDSESDPNKKRKFVSSFGLADLPQVIRVLQLAQEHAESEEAAVI